MRPDRRRVPAVDQCCDGRRLNSFSHRGTEGAIVQLTGTVQGKQFCAPFTMRAPSVVEMTVQPRFIKLEAKDFGPYVEGEGLIDVQKLRRERNQDNAPGRELYSRYAKLLIGPIGAVASKPVGHALEIVPSRDPRELSRGDPLQVMVLFQGKPLPDAQVRWNETAGLAEAIGCPHALDKVQRRPANEKGYQRITGSGEAGDDGGNRSGRSIQSLL